MVALAGSGTVISADIVGSSGRSRSGQRMLDQGMDRVFDDALANSPYIREHVFRRPDGDSTTLVTTAVVPRAWIAADLVRELEVALRSFNEHVDAASRLRLRMAIAHGELEITPPHVNGTPVTLAARLRELEAVRDQARHSGDQLTLVVSERFFDDVVSERERDLDPTDYRLVTGMTKEGRAVRGYLRSVRRAEPAPGGSSAAAASPDHAAPDLTATGPTVHYRSATHVNGPVAMGDRGTATDNRGRDPERRP